MGPIVTSPRRSDLTASVKRRQNSGGFHKGVLAHQAAHHGALALRLALVAALILVVLFLGRPLGHLGKRLLRWGAAHSDLELLGRNDAQYPAPHCCSGGACVQPGRTAVVTYIRSDSYMPLLQQLHCSLRKSNPGVELAAMMVEGELSGASLDLLRRLNITLLPVQPLTYENHYNSRYGANFIKLRAWELTQYSAMLLVDSDTVVVGPVGHLFDLPVEFAASWDQSRLLGRYNTQLTGINGGVIMLRPCPAVQRHMVSLLDAHAKLRFSHGAAEQDFFTWYFRFDGMMLPVEYNTMASDSLQEDGRLTIGGRPPVIVHFTQNKPFAGAVPGKPGHHLLCSPSELRAAARLRRR